MHFDSRSCPSAKYCQLWLLKPSTSKTVQVPNNRSGRELNVHMNGQRLKHDPYPVFLGVTLDQTLSYRYCHVRKEVLSCSAVALKSRINLIAKVAGTSWGASTSTLCTSALALCYSVAEYCCPVWARSRCTNTKHSSTKGSGLACRLDTFLRIVHVRCILG